MSASGFERWDCAAFFGGNDLRIYTAHKDAEIERALLEAGERFWRKHILEGIEPEIGATETSARYLRERFPRPTQNLREATPEELEMALEYRDADEVFKLAKEKRDKLKMRLAERIGDAEGITFPGGKITYKLAKGCTYTVVKETSRRFLPKFDEKRRTAA
jgi:predicted phage-related endonuclease